MLLLLPRKSTEEPCQSPATGEYSQWNLGHPLSPGSHPSVLGGHVLTPEGHLPSPGGHLLGPGGSPPHPWGVTPSVLGVAASVLGGVTSSVLGATSSLLGATSSLLSGSPSQSWGSPPHSWGPPPQSWRVTSLLGGHLLTPEGHLTPGSHLLTPGSHLTPGGSPPQSCGRRGSALITLAQSGHQVFLEGRGIIRKISAPRGHSPRVATHSQGRDATTRGKLRLHPGSNLTPDGTRGQAHLPGGVRVCIVLQQQLCHAHLPVLGCHVERGKSFLRRNTGSQKPGSLRCPPQGKGLHAAKEAPTPAGTEMQEKARNGRSLLDTPDWQPVLL